MTTVFNYRKRIHFLPPNLTFPYRRVVFAPVYAEGIIGIMEVQEQRGTNSTKSVVSRYLIQYRPPTADGDHYRLIKSGGETTYDVEIGPRPLCHCTGFLQYGKCKHVEGLTVLQSEGHLQSPLDYQI